MPRDKKERCCRELDDEICYSPRGIKFKEGTKIVLTIDEFEAMRLCDHEGNSQIDAAAKMHVSRGTIQRILISGRKKMIEAFLTGSCICIKNK